MVFSCFEDVQVRIKQFEFHRAETSLNDTSKIVTVIEQLIVFESIKNELTSTLRMVK